MTKFRKVGGDAVHLFFAQFGNQVLEGGLDCCLKWSQCQIMRNPDAIVKILKARSCGRYAQVIIEMTSTDTVFIKKGRVLAVKKLVRAVENGKK